MKSETYDLLGLYRLLTSTENKLMHINPLMIWTCNPIYVLKRLSYRSTEYCLIRFLLINFTIALRIFQLFVTRCTFLAA